MISPATSGEIFTSVSGCTLPVAETVCIIVLRTAFSVVTGIGFSRLLQMIDTAIQSTTRPIDAKMICFLRRARRCLAVKGAGAGVLTVWCIGGGVVGMKASALVGCLTLANEIPFMTTLEMRPGAALDSINYGVRAGCRSLLPMAQTGSLARSNLLNRPFRVLCD